MKNLLYTPNLLLQKFPAPSFRATTKVSLEAESLESVRAGLVILGYDYSTLTIVKKADGLYLEQSFAKKANDGGVESIQESIKLDQKIVWLGVEVKGPEASVIYSYSLDGETYKSIGKQTMAKVGRWVGSKVGIFCSKTNSKVGGYADFDWFRISEL